MIWIPVVAIVVAALRLWVFLGDPLVHMRPLAHIVGVTLCWSLVIGVALATMMLLAAEGAR